MRHIKTLILATALVLTAVSCSTPKDITYIQNLTPGHPVDVSSMQEIKSRTGDRISIIVHSKDPQLASIFNLAIPRNTFGAMTNSTNYVQGTTDQVASYTINEYGKISFPIIGEVYVVDKTREEIATTIADEIKARELLSDPIVIVEFINHSFVALGAVNSPGRHFFSDDYLTIIEALGIAGDLQLTGVRTDVKVVRKVNGKEVAYMIDLTNADSVYGSPAYFILPDDMIYVDLTNTAKRNTTPNGNTLLTPGFWMSLTTFCISIATLLIVK